MMSVIYSIKKPFILMNIGEIDSLFFLSKIIIDGIMDKILNYNNNNNIKLFLKFNEKFR